MSGIPVLYYHRVNDVEPVPQDVSTARFDEQMAFLARDGWKTVTPAEVDSFLAGSLKLPRKSALITFDDGYLDNWVYAYPILKKNGLKATIFLITDRITDVEKTPRPTMDDVESGKVARESLPHILPFNEANRIALGSDADKATVFLVWAEVLAMQKSGLISFGSHSHTHGAHYVGDQIEGIINTALPHWTRALPTGGDIRLGIPRYPQASALKGRRYFDDPGLRDAAAKFVADSGGAIFLNQMGAKEVEKLVRNLAQDYRAKYGDNGRFETDAERRERVMKELVTSRQIMAERLDAPPESICWPFGHYDDFAIECALDAGYRMAFSTRTGVNRPGIDAFRLRRIVVREWPAQQLKKSLEFWTGPLARIANVFSN